MLDGKELEKRTNSESELFRIFCSEK